MDRNGMVRELPEATARIRVDLERIEALLSAFRRLNRDERRMVLQVARELDEDFV